MQATSTTTNALRRAWLQHAYSFSLKSSTPFHSSMVSTFSSSSSSSSTSPTTTPTNTTNHATNATTTTTTINPSEVAKIDSSFAIKLVTEQYQNVACISGAPDTLQTRYVRIFQPSKTAMQSGEHLTHHWLISFDTQDRWQNPLIGWTSSSDPMQATTIEFPSKEAAIRFATNQGWQYKVIEKTTTPFEKKSYAANFVYSSKKLRLFKTK